MKILLVDGTARRSPLGTRNQPDCRNGLQRMADKRGGQFLVAPDQLSGYATNQGLARVDDPALRVLANSGSSAAASLQLFRRENIALDFCAYFQYITASLIHSQLV